MCDRSSLARTEALTTVAAVIATGAVSTARHARVDVAKGAKTSASFAELCHAASGRRGARQLGERRLGVRVFLHFPRPFFDA